MPESLSETMQRTAPGDVRVERALLSVFDKRGLVDFARVAARRGVSEEEVVENIDVGGPTMIRAAAKNHAHVAVVVRPESYDAVIEELNEFGGRLSAQTRESLATEAFGATARYDAAISRWFAEREEDFPNHFVAAFEK